MIGRAFDREHGWVYGGIVRQGDPDQLQPGLHVHVSTAVYISYYVLQICEAPFASLSSLSQLRSVPMKKFNIQCLSNTDDGQLRFRACRQLSFLS